MRPPKPSPPVKDEPNPKMTSRVSSQSAASWNSRKGPEPGVRWKSGQYPPVPVWKYDASDMRAFAKFTKKISIWQLQMAPYASKKDQALLLYNSLTGEPEQELEHLSIEELYVDDGVQLILKLLQKPLEQRLVYQKRKFLHEFEVLRRIQNESMRTYVQRFRRTQRSLKAVGVDVTGTYDSESLGSRLLDRSGLSHADQRMILVSTQQSLQFESIAEALTLQYPEFRAAPPVVNKDGKGAGKSKSAFSGSSSSTMASTSSSSPSTRTPGYGGKGAPVRRAMVTNVEDTAEAGDEDELEPIAEEAEDDHVATSQGDGSQDASGSEETNLQELAQVLTVTARKLSGITLGRKFTTGNAAKSKKSPEELRKVTHCSACGALGHWHSDPECPHNQGKGGKSKSSAGTSSGGKGPPQRPKMDKRDSKPHRVAWFTMSMEPLSLKNRIPSMARCSRSTWFPWAHISSTRLKPLLTKTCFAVSWSWIRLAREPVAVKCGMRGMWNISPRSR